MGGLRGCARNLARMAVATSGAARPRAELEGLLVERDALIAGQSARIAELEVIVAELRARVDQNSRNSSKPPSSDGYAKTPVNEAEPAAEVRA